MTMLKKFGFAKKNNRNKDKKKFDQTFERKESQNKTKITRMRR